MYSALDLCTLREVVVPVIQYTAAGDSYFDWGLVSTAPVTGKLRKR